MDDEGKKLSLSGTLSRRLSKKFSRRVAEEDSVISSSAPASSASSSSSSSRPSDVRPPTPTSGMPSAADVEQRFLIVCKKTRSSPDKPVRTLEEKWKLVSEFSAAQKNSSAEELVKIVRRTAKKPRFLGQLGFFAYICGQNHEWIAEFVKLGGVEQLLKLSAKLAGESSEDFKLFGDLLLFLCFPVIFLNTLESSKSEVVTTDEGMEAVPQQERLLPNLYLALDLCEERVQIELLQTVSAVSLRSQQACGAILRSLFEKKLLPTQKTAGRSSRQRSHTADSPSHQADSAARNLAWTGLDRLTNLLVGGGSSDDLHLAAVMAVHALLLRVPRDLHDLLMEGLKQADLAAKLDLLLRDTNDPELRALVGVLRERNAEFRTRDLAALAGGLAESLRFQRESHAALGNMLEHLQRLDRSNSKAWTLLEGFVKSVCMAPAPPDDDVAGWFSGLLLASACDSNNSARNAQLEALKSQLDMAMRRIENCPQCSAQSSAAVNPVVMMRQLRTQKHGEGEEESSDESSEFVDVDLDGVRASKTFALSGPKKESAIKRKSPLPGVSQEDIESMSFPIAVSASPREKKELKAKRKSLLVESLKDETLLANEAQAIADLLNLK